eukprot:TRINITY_DN22688_c0_g1_i1.p1 TRINITY_DN22688_c0_g1~~TRINITY_DN22688_c0_g1_i1.p1  ORF type:complete len:210 (+),score=36.17 TRINITY_DN22688_c0_g1_i1:200-829(+)
MSRNVQQPAHGKELVSIDAFAAVEASTTEYDRQTSDSLVTSWEWTRTPSVEAPFEWAFESPGREAGALLNSSASMHCGVIPSSQWSAAVTQLLPFLNQEGIRHALQILDAALNNVQRLKSRGQSQGPRDLEVHRQLQQQLMAQLMLLQTSNKHYAWQVSANSASSGPASLPSDLPQDMLGRNGQKVESLNSKSGVWDPLAGRIHRETED